MADPTIAGDPGEQAQPKAALHYRQGGDHCGVCMYFEGAADGKGTCSRVLPPDVDSADLCDDFARAGREKAAGGGGGNTAVAGMADQLAKRGLISPKAMKNYMG